MIAFALTAVYAAVALLCIGAIAVDEAARTAPQYAFVLAGVFWPIIALWILIER